jgi:hypothetical protein
MLFEERIDAQEDGRVAVAWHVLKPGQPSFWDVPLDDALYLVGISSGPLDARVFRGAALLDRQRAGRPRDGLPSSVKKKFSLLLDEAFRGEIAVVTGAAIRVGGRLGFTVEAIAERATMAVRDAVHRMRSSAPPAPPKP